MSFGETLGSGIILLLIGAVAYASWHDPRAYLKMFWIPAAALFIAAAGLSAINAAYGWGWADALSAISSVDPVVAAKVGQRTGQTQDAFILGITAAAVYVLIMAGVAISRNSSASNRNAGDKVDEPKP